LLLVLTAVVALIFKKSWFVLFGISVVLGWMVFIGALWQQFELQPQTGLAFTFIFLLYGLFQTGQWLLYTKNETPEKHFVYWIALANTIGLLLAVFEVIKVNKWDNNAFGLILLIPSLIAYLFAIAYLPFRQKGAQRMAWFTFGFVMTFALGLISNKDSGVYLVPLCIAILFVFAGKMFKSKIALRFGYVYICFSLLLSFLTFLMDSDRISDNLLFDFVWLKILAALLIICFLLSLIKYERLELPNWETVINYLLPLGFFALFWLIISTLLVSLEIYPYVKSATSSLFKVVYKQSEIEFIKTVHLLSIGAGMNSFLIYRRFERNLTGVNFQTTLQFSSILYLATFILLTISIGFYSWEWIRIDSVDWPVNRSPYLLVRYLVYGGILLVLWQLKGLFKENQLNHFSPSAQNILIALTLLTFISADIVFWFSEWNLPHPERLAISIFWVVSALVLLIIGIKKSKPGLKGLAFVLIGVSVAKLFLFDLQNLGVEFRIILFVVVGLLLSGFSFLYSKLNPPEKPK
jgi:hypothetical protein